MTANSRVSPAIRLRGTLLVLVAVGFAACSGGESLVSSEAPLTPVDSTTPPADSTPTPPPPEPGDTVVPPPPDPQDTVIAPPEPPPQLPPEPPDTTGPPLPPSAPPVHHGIPFGPSVFTKGESAKTLIPPSELSPEFTALVTDAHLPTLLAKLEAARRNSDRVLLSFDGVSHLTKDENGFNITLWKQRLERFRGIDFTSYVADGTLIGHFMLDEPNDRSNWNGHQVPLPVIDEMAKYSKEIWPNLPAIVRAYPSFLKGYQYQYLDAAWAQYHVRFGSVEDFIASNARDAKIIGVALVTGMNVVAGGGRDGIPGYFRDKFAMTASQVRAFGTAILAEPHICAFFMFRYNPDYFSRPDIRSAMAELSRKAQDHSKRACRRS